MWLACVGLSLVLRQGRGGGGVRGLHVWPLNDLPARSSGPFCHIRAEWSTRGRPTLACVTARRRRCSRSRRGHVETSRSTDAAPKDGLKTDLSDAE